ncbi:MAG: bifunctional folylpolyglutamate synthase/dihydrofolate synthase [Bacteroidales bacterium]
MMKSLGYNDAISFLFSRLPMYQKVGGEAFKPGLENTLRLSLLYDNPHESNQYIHVAGTNGKGSVSHTLASILQAHGLNVGLYTSPHLKDFSERIRINGVCVEADFVIRFVHQLKLYFESGKIDFSPSFFEITFLMSLVYFQEKAVDVAIIETGLGGEFDSTNIIRPLVSVITNIGIDHTHILGNSLESIAEAKAGIIKPQTPVVIGRRQEETVEVFSTKSQKLGASLYFSDTLFQLVDKGLSSEYDKRRLHITNLCNAVDYEASTDLANLCQVENMRTALSAVHILNAVSSYNIDLVSIRQGLSSICSSTGFCGRWQVVGHNPLMVLDTAHNADGVGMLMQQLLQVRYEKLHIVFGVVADKDINKVLSLLPRTAMYYFVPAGNENKRSLEPKELAHTALRYGLVGNVYESVEQGFAKAKSSATSSDLVLATGSTFVVAELV